MPATTRSAAAASAPAPAAPSTTSISSNDVDRLPGEAFLVEEDLAEPCSTKDVDECSFCRRLCGFDFE
jgi:hypothetical protein